MFHARGERIHRFDFGLAQDFREDPQEHSSLFNVIGPNPWNLGQEKDTYVYNYIQVSVGQWMGPTTTYNSSRRD